MGDILKRDSPQSKVVGVSMKDRSAILMGGRRADAAYWFENEGGNFITSTYYMAASARVAETVERPKVCRSILRANFGRDCCPTRRFMKSMLERTQLKASGIARTSRSRIVFAKAPPAKGYYEDFPTNTVCR